MPRIRETLVRSRGVSLVDALVGIAIGALALVIVHEAFVAFDTLRRNAVSSADAQSSGAFAMYSLASQIGNAGAGIAGGARWLDTCPASTDVATTTRPVAVLITDGGAADRPDALVVRRSLAAAIVPAALTQAAPAGASFRAEAAAAIAAGDRVLAVARTGACALTQAIAVAPTAAGVVDIAHTALTSAFPVSTVLLNLGAAGDGWVTRFDVSSGTLRSTDIANGDAPVPLVSNVVNLKFLYGIDSDGDGALDTWTGAGSADWTPATLLAAPRSILERIKAIRVGLIVRGERTDRALTRGYHWVLFDCDAADKSTCPGRLEGTIAAAASGGYRYRAYETIVPLRNVIWNRGP